MGEIYSTEQGGRLPQTQPKKLDETSAKVIGGSSSVGALCGLGAGVLGIIGLSGALPVELCSVAAIVAGVGLMFEGGAIAARFQKIRSTIAAVEGERGPVIAEAGMSAEMIGGISAVVLGILSLIHIVPMVLLPISVIILGMAFLIGSGEIYEEIEVPAQASYSQRSVQMAHRAASSAAGFNVLIGIAAIVLGILGLINVAGHAIVLSLVAVLCVGVGELITDSAITARMMSIFRQR